VTPHDGFAHFNEAFGFESLALSGRHGNEQASAFSVAAVLDEIRANDLPVIFAENIRDRRLLDRVAEEVGVQIAGPLYSDALSGPDGPAPTYLAMMRYNARQIAALAGPIDSCRKRDSDGGSLSRP